MIFQDSWDVITVFTAGVGTLAIFCFLIKENRFYSFFEHLFIGVASGWGVFVVVKNFLWPKIVVPLLALDQVQYPDGTYSYQYNPAVLLYLLPVFFGLFYYSIYFKRYSWLSNIVIGLSLGAAAGLSFEGFFNQMLPQVFSSFKPLVVFENGELQLGLSFNNIFFLITLLSVMYYFFFSFRSNNSFGRVTISTGRFLMMAAFGAYFGSTVMARMALLVERLQFLLTDWVASVGALWSMIV